MSYLFVFRSAPDVDHISPLAWKLLEEGEDVHAVVSSSFVQAHDHRLELLRGYPGFHLHQVAAFGRPQGGLLARITGYVRHTLPFAVALLAAKRVRCVGVEWGSGLPEGYDRPRSRAGLKALARTLVGSFRPASRDKHQTRTVFMAAARLLGVPTVCLPHGLNVKLDAATSDAGAAELARGPLAWDDRNRFSAFVLNTDHHRDWYIEYARGNPDVMQTWGSLRWSPEWFALNRRLAPPFSWPEDTDRLKVVYMVPKWGNRVHAREAAQLLQAIQSLDFVSLAVMGHPRVATDAAVANGTGTDDPFAIHADIDWDAVHDVTGVNSVSLIEECDVVVDVGSSIGIEVLMQGKTLVNPTYIHELTTFFDTIDDVAVVAHSPATVTDYLATHAQGKPHHVSDSAYDELLRQAVYASRPEPFDVLEEYASQMAGLARSGRPPRTRIPR